MFIRFSILFLLVCFSCQSPEDSRSKKAKKDTVVKMEFDASKWKEKRHMDYPYRNDMVDDLIESRRLKPLSKEEILDLLGPPDRINENYLYYQVKQKRIEFWPLHTKTLVIRISADSTENSVMIHE